MRFVNGEKRQWQAPQPANGIGPSQPLRRKIQQPVRAFHRLAHHGALIFRRLRAVDQRRRNAHIAELRHLVLHQGDQWRDHHDSLRQRHCRQLIAQRFSAARGHHHRRIRAGHEALHNAFLHRPERIITPVAFQSGVQIFHGKFECINLRGMLRS